MIQNSINALKLIYNVGMDPKSYIIIYFMLSNILDNNDELTNELYEFIKTC